MGRTTLLRIAVTRLQVCCCQARRGSHLDAQDERFGDVGKQGGRHLQRMFKSLSNALAAKRREAVHNTVADLQSCADLRWGRRIHARAVQHGYEASVHVLTGVIKMYANCGNMVEARRVFDGIQKPDAVSWTSLLLGYADNGEGQVCVDLFSRMKADGCIPNSVTYLAALKACTALAVNGEKSKGLEVGRRIHSETAGCLNLFVQNTLIGMYAKCGSMDEARRVFDSVQEPDVVSWTALLMGYAENGEGLICLELFSKMKLDGCAPNSVTYVAALKACTSLAVHGEKPQGLEAGRNIHSDIGCHLNLCVQNVLIDMYAKCGSMLDARQVFDSIWKPDVMSWTGLLLGYAENGEGRVALDLFSKMKDHGCAPNSVTYLAVLKACTSVALNGDASEQLHGLEVGRRIHLEIGDNLDLFVQNTLIDMYAKCGSMLDAREVFDSINKPDVVSWTALLLGYAENGQGQVSLELFSKMKVDGCVPNSVTYVSALKACTSLAVNGDVGEGLEAGRKIHSETGCLVDLYVQNTLIDMYAKCGKMVDAHLVFDRIQYPDVVSWNALLLGYGDNGEAQVSLDLFSRMKAAGCAPNSVTYVAALKACSSTGSLVLGRKIHSDISEFTVHVVTCLVDFYAKCGSMTEAHAVFDLQSQARAMATWNALLAGYSSCGDTDTAFSLFEAMQDTGFRPDGVTFVTVLLCCNHAGLVRKARQYLTAMPVQYGVTPDVIHYNSMVDALGRANQLVEAVSVLREMPCSPNMVTWSALLGACRQWKNAQLGRLAFQSLVETNKTDGSAYSLMAQIYGSCGMLEEQQTVLNVWQSRSLDEDGH